MPDFEFTNQDHDNMEEFVSHVLDDHKNGTITTLQASSALKHVIAALMIGNTGEAARWFQQGRKWVNQGR